MLVLKSARFIRTSSRGGALPYRRNFCQEAPSLSKNLNFNQRPYFSPLAGSSDGKQFEDEKLYKETRKPVTEATSFPAEGYRSFSFYEKEKQNVWSKGWVCVGWLDQVRNPGDTFLATVADQPIFVTRTKKGELKAFYNVCRHRGSQLVNKDGCYEAFRCPYHSWAYSPEGKLVATPLFNTAENPEQEKQVPKDFDKKNYSLFPITVETWGGMIMVNLDPKPQVSFLDHLGDLPKKYANYPLEELVIVRSKVYSIKANWKLAVENFMEYYHLPWVHPELCTVSGVDEHKRNQGPGGYVGFCTSPLSEGGTPLDASFFPPMSDKLTETEKKSAYFLSLFPNVSWFLFPHHLAALIMIPKGPHETEELLTVAVHPNLLKEPDAQNKLDKMMNFYDMVNVQDVVAVEKVMNGVACGPYQGGRLTFRFEEPLHRFQNMLIDYMIKKPTVPKGDA